MIYKESELEQEVKPQFRRGKKITNYEESITMRIDTETLDEFKEIVGIPYQPKIRELMRDYIDRHKYTYAQEEKRRNKMLGKRA